MLNENVVIQGKLAIEKKENFLTIFVQNAKSRVPLLFLKVISKQIQAFRADTFYLKINNDNYLEQKKKIHDNCLHKTTTANMKHLTTISVQMY